MTADAHGTARTRTQRCPGRIGRRSSAETPERLASNRRSPAPDGRRSLVQHGRPFGFDVES